MNGELFQVVVIGSGFGGAVTACRAAQAGRDVLVLERGKRYRPGEFPRSEPELSTNIWEPSKGLFGLFQVWSFRQIDAVVSSGVGGGSLIGDDVLVRMPQTWFSKKDWPLRYSDIEEHYGTVEQMMSAEPIPLGMHQRVSEAAVCADAAQHTGMNLQPAGLALAVIEREPHPGDPFDSPEANLESSYLSHARRYGAEIRPLHEVKRITAVPGGYELDYVVHRPTPHPGEPLALTRVRAKTVVVAAGALGSTWLLLANRPGLPHLSGQLGTRFSDNGDALGALSADRDITKSPHVLHRWWARRWWQHSGSRPNRNVSTTVAEALDAARRSRGTPPLLTMGLDPARGTMRLADGRLDLAASPEGSRGSWRSRSITAHPLGGCPMGKDAVRGVVNQHGEAFGHPGLFVADGSVLPAAVGAYPSLTIAALAERFAHKIVHRSR